MGLKQHFDCIVCNGDLDFQQKEFMLKDAPEIWSVKYTKFNTFPKHHALIAHLIPGDYFAPRETFLSFSLSFCAALLLLRHIF